MFVGLYKVLELEPKNPWSNESLLGCNNQPYQTNKRCLGCRTSHIIECGFNPSAVRGMISRGDAAAARGDLANARIEYDNARKVSKQLLSFYRDLSGAFRGLDAVSYTHLTLPTT